MWLIFCHIIEAGTLPNHSSWLEMQIGGAKWNFNAWNFYVNETDLNSGHTGKEPIKLNLQLL